MNKIKKIKKTYIYKKTSVFIVYLCVWCESQIITLSWLGYYEINKTINTKMNDLIEWKNIVQTKVPFMEMSA